MHNFNKKMAAAFVVAAFAVPMIASADTASSTSDTSSDVQAKIQTLLAEIKSLQEQLKAIIASSTAGWTMTGSSTMNWNPGQMGKMACITLNRSLHQGDQGDDVKSIQQMLKDDSSTGFAGNVTGFFGPLTAKAMAMFQMHNGIASSTDGSVGPLTRGFFERHCGKGEGNGNGGQGGGMGKAPDGDMNVMWVRGTISANNTSNITVTAGSNTVVVNITASTSIKVFAGTSTPPTTGSVSDLIVGKQIMAGGSKNSDGSIQATMISVGDNLPMMMGDDHGGQGGDNHGPMMPSGFMPTTNGEQHGPGLNGGPQNW